jgi:hypothetical protein
MDIEVTVDVDKIDLNTVMHEGDDYERSETLADIIADKAMERLVKSAGWKSVEDRVSEIRDGEIRSRVAALVEEAMKEPTQRTDGWGNPKGPQTTLREMVMEAATTVMQARSGGYGSETVAQKIVREEVSTAFRKELAEAIAAEKAKVVALVRAEAARLITGSITAGIGGKP